MSSMGDIDYYLWYDPLGHVEGTYYHRQNEKYGEATYCVDCCSRGIQHRYCIVLIHSLILSRNMFICHCQPIRYCKTALHFISTVTRSRNCVYLTNEHGNTLCECQWSSDRRKALKQRYIEKLTANKSTRCRREGFLCKNWISWTSYFRH